jgi:SpoVK/Ycf46/Vps4 family AAA+-type ATPase
MSDSDEIRCGPDRKRPNLQVGLILLGLLANETKDFSGALLTKICQRAHKSALRESIQEKKNVLDKQQCSFFLLFLK